MADSQHNIVGYHRMVSDMMKAFPEDEAMSRAVGGNFDYFGVLERLVLEVAGLRPTSCVLDVGCGSGRLAVQLAPLRGLTYKGTDIVPSLLEYAARRCARPDFTFQLVDNFTFDDPDSSYDLVCFFSVVTHLLPEESFVYLSEAVRVLRPGGSVVLSFLDPMLAEHWPVFQADADAVRGKAQRGHINAFIHQDQLRDWTRRLNARVKRIIPGTEKFINMRPERATAAVPAGRYALGQSLAIITKPLERDGSLLAAPPITGCCDASPHDRVLYGWARVEGRSDVRLTIEVVQDGAVIGTGRTGTERADVGLAGFVINLTEPLDDLAYLNGKVEVLGRMEGWEPVVLSTYQGLRDALWQRHALKVLREVPEAERARLVRDLLPKD
jgi:SAM-dependent methyltransferase